MKIITSLLFVLTMAMQVALSANDVYKSTLLEARESARSNNTPYAVIFVAAWASPCQWMENFTLNDDQVTSYIKNHYSAVKMDIDEFEGYALKEEYHIDALPTILIFNNQHEVIGRYENTFRSPAFVDLLKWHSDFKKSKAPVSNAEKIMASSKSNIGASTGTTTGSTTDVRNPCTIQVGAFGSLNNAEKLRKRVQKKFPNSKLHVYTLANEKYAYRVTIGDFARPEDATSLLFDLDKKGLQGIIKKKSLFGR